jgi:DNA invertase Pin-like site-specific DNA recombinase
MKIIAYIRISTDKQDLDNQKLSILNYARNNNFRIDDFIEIKMSSKKSDKERKIDELLKELNQGDTLIVCELSRLGRSLGQIIKIVDELIKNKNKFIAIKENCKIRLESRQRIRRKKRHCPSASKLL